MCLCVSNTVYVQWIYKVSFNSHIYEDFRSKHIAVVYVVLHGWNVSPCFVAELGMLSGIAAILRFPISDPDDNEDENDADSSSDND